MGERPLDNFRPPPHRLFADLQARKNGDRWEVFIEGAWEKVPAKRVLQQHNMDGRPIACEASGMIRCFVPPAAET
jgi:hypothetical protein